MSTIESAQREIGQLIRFIDEDINRRGVLLLDRAQTLLDAVKRAMLTRSLCEQVTPADFFNDQWRQQSNKLKQCETRLERIIRGTAIPMEDHER